MRQTCWRGAPSVATDNYLGGHLAAQHLSKLGHRQIAMLCGQSDIQNVRDRMAGFSDELRRHGVAIDPLSILHGHQDLELGSRIGELSSRLLHPKAADATTFLVEPTLKVQGSTGNLTKGGVPAAPLP